MLLIHAVVVVVVLYTDKRHAIRGSLVVRPISRDVRKTEIQFGFGFKNRTVQKIDICSDGFPMETA